MHHISTLAMHGDFPSHCNVYNITDLHIWPSHIGMFVFAFERREKIRSITRGLNKKTKLFFTTKGLNTECVVIVNIFKYAD